MLIDSHSHIYAEEFNEDRGQAIQRAVEAGVKKIILPNIDSSSVLPMLTVAKEYRDVCYPLIGLHPTSVNESYKKELDEIRSWLDKATFYGIGEVGTDLYWDKTYLKEQEDVFRQQVKLAKEMKLPLVIHVRKSFGETFSVLEKENDGSLTGIFHCFSGGINEAKKVIGLGFKLGIGGVVTFQNSHLAETLKNISLSELVLETDSPYLAPVPFRGKRNEPSYITYVAAKVAEIYSVSIGEVERITSGNVVNLFGL